MSRPQPQESGHGPILMLPIDDVCPSPENDELYKPIDRRDTEFRKLVASVRDHGILEPLVVTEDGWIVSGHRRHAAAEEAGLEEVPCRVMAIRREDDTDRFVRLLREHNRQRAKTTDEKVREELLTVDPARAHRVLRGHRDLASAVDLAPIAVAGSMKRSEISEAKRPFLDAVLRVIDERSQFLPLSDRQIHYALLNDPPLRHAKKPHSTYGNDRDSYKSLVDLLTRARIDGFIPMNVIADATRPVSTWAVHPDIRPFIRREVDRFLMGYHRDLMQSQPHHIEIVCEKNTVQPLLRPTAAEYCIPLTSGRGYCSLPPRAEMADRYRRSGKPKLVLLLLTDFDPDGEEIAMSLARSLRDDFDVHNLHPVKVALTAEQVAEFELAPNLQAKVTSSRYAKFAAKYGDDVFELEAIPPERLQDLLRSAINSVIDEDAYREELAKEEQEAADLVGYANVAREAMRSAGFDGADAPGGDG